MLQFEQHARRRPEQAIALLRAAGEEPDRSSTVLRAGGAPVARAWEVDDDPGGSRVSLAVWLLDGDVESMAIAATDEDVLFGRIISVIDTETLPAPLRCADWLQLMEHYSRGIAAALADTD